MLAGSFAFTLMGALTHALGPRCDWQLIALARTALALAFAAGLALAAGVRFVVFRPRSLWMRSIAGSLSLVCTFFALTRLPMTDVLTLSNMFPVWVAFLSWPLLGERPTRGVWVSVASGVAGVVLIQQPHFAAGNFATLIQLAGSVFTALAMIGLHRLKNLDVRAVVAHFSGVSLLFVVASFYLFDHSDYPAARLDSWALLMLLGVGVTATIGQLFLTQAFSAGSPAKVSVVGLTQILFAMVLDVLLWGRTFNAVTLVGMALIVAPTAWLMARRG
jgi:drug/metabolite transporter (DMT)-like permease